jgi:hypothetical protein
MREERKPLIEATQWNQIIRDDAAKLTDELLEKCFHALAYDQVYGPRHDSEYPCFVMVEDDRGCFISFVAIIFALTFRLSALRAKNTALEAKVRELESILATQNIVLEQYQHPKVEIITTGSQSPSAPEASQKECNLCCGKGKLKRRELGLHDVGYNQLSDELIKCSYCGGTGKVPADAQGESQEKEVNPAKAEGD